MISTPFINIHTHQPCFDDEIKAIVNLSIKDLSKKLPVHNMYSIGIHPWNIQEPNIILPDISEIIAKKNCIALGEIGLDKSIKTNFNIQEEVFIKQLKLATEFQKPVIVHCVKAYAELIRIKKNYTTGTKWIVHGFNKNQQVADSLLKENIYLSFGKSIFNNFKLQDVFRNIPVNQFFLETDDSEITIKEIYQKAGELKEIGLVELKKRIQINFETCFKHDE